MMGGMPPSAKKGIDARSAPGGMGATGEKGVAKSAASQSAPSPDLAAGGMGGARPVIDASKFAVLFPGLKAQHPADVERNKAIDDLLEKVVPMHFANETPLEEVLKYLKENLKDGKGKSIPIYLDPIGLQQAEKTPQSTVTLDLDDLPVRTTLRLVLDQLSLGFRVRDGIVYIQDNSTIAEEDERESSIESRVKGLIERGIIPPAKSPRVVRDGGLQ
jgi:hypothetical protein